MPGYVKNVAMDLYRRRLCWRLRRRPPRPVVGAAMNPRIARHRICNQLDEHGALSDNPVADQTHILNGQGIFQRAKRLPKRSFIF
jgi:hypothetical protein